MSAIRLHPPGGIDALVLEQVDIPRVGAGEALVRVGAAAITRGELDWPVERLPAIPSYEFSGTIAALAGDVRDLAVGDEVYALTGFDRDGAAAEYAVMPAQLLAPKPRTLAHVESAAIPLAGLTAWQGLFDHGGLQAGERVLIHGATGGVGHLAIQLARWRGTHVIATTTRTGLRKALELGAHEALDREGVHFEEAVEPVDLVLDTAGGETLARSSAVLRDGGRLVSVAEEPPASTGDRIRGIYFVVEPSREQLVELAGLADQGRIRPVIDSVFALSDARRAFERVMMRGKRGKVVLRVATE